MASADKKARLISNYPDAFTDTYGVVGNAPFIYKTGPPWPRPEPASAYPVAREMRPVCFNHPIELQWSAILRKIRDHFWKVDLPPSVIAGLAFGNTRDTQNTFCPLIVVIGIPPEDRDYDFNLIKDAAEHIKQVILTDAGFPHIDVAIREWVVSPSNRDIQPARLSSLNPVKYRRSTTELAHVFSSNPGLAIAQLNKPSTEGTLGAYFQLTDPTSGEKIYLGLTCCHVVLPKVRALRGLQRQRESSGYKHKIIAVGSGALEDVIITIQNRIVSLQDSLAGEYRHLAWTERRLEDDSLDRESAEEIFETSKEDIAILKRDINLFHQLSLSITKNHSKPNERYIGYVCFAEPIMASSSDAFSAHTVDWAFVQLDRNAFSPPFSGNKVYVGGNISKEQYGELMFPCPADRRNFQYPEDGLLQISGYVPESEIRNPQQRDGEGKYTMPVVKNGRTSGTTVGWLNGLESYVRHIKFAEDDTPFDLEVMETTFVPYGQNRPGAFSKGGDSGSAILDRGGRFLALLSGGAGLTDEHDITFGTAAYQLMPRITQAIPGATLLPPM